MKFTVFNTSFIKYSFALLIPFIVMSASCKKEEAQEEPEPYPPYVHLNFHNHKDSQHFVYLIETRIMDESGTYVDENWSENIMNPGQNIKANDSASFYITMDRNHMCEFRFGVINNEGHLIQIYEQEGWYTPINPFFSRAKLDDVNFSVTARTASDGIIYIQDWQ